MILIFEDSRHEKRPENTPMIFEAIFEKLSTGGQG